MNRRDVLIAGSAGFSTFIAGCASNMSSDESESEKEPPEWPENQSEPSITEYATQYMEVIGYNKKLSELDDGESYEELSYSCSGAFETEVSVGYIVTISCYVSETINEGLFGDSYSSSGPEGPYSLLVNQNEVIQASIKHEWKEFIETAESPYTTRGLTIVNFSDENQVIQTTIEDKSSEDLEKKSTVLTREYDLEAGTGETDLGLIEDPGNYSVEVSSTSDTTIDNWRVNDESRDPTIINEDSTLDIALGIYILPDQTVEIHGIPETRITVE